MLTDLNEPLGRWGTGSGHTKTVWASSSDGLDESLERARLLETRLVSVVGRRLQHCNAKGFTRNVKTFLLDFLLVISVKQRKAGPFSDVS